MKTSEIKNRTLLTDEQYQKHAKAGTLYLLNDYEDAVFRYDPEQKQWYSKLDGVEEFPVDVAINNSLAEARVRRILITKEEYEKV